MKETTREFFFRLKYIFDYKKTFELKYSFTDENNNVRIGKKHILLNFDLTPEENINKMIEIENDESFLFWSGSKDAEKLAEFIMKNGNLIK